MLNLQPITIYHITDTSTGQFEQIHLSATIHKKNAQKQDDGGFCFDNAYIIRIPTKTPLNIQIDDYIVLGEGRSNKIPYGAYKVVSVTDNRRGVLSHIRIEAV